MYTIYHNGTIVTMEEDAIYAEAVVTNKDKIVYVGTYEEALEVCHGKRIKKHDLQGKTMFPGFIDAHSHFTMAFQQSAFADLTGLDSFEAIINKLKGYKIAEKKNAKKIIFGFGYDNNLLPEYKHPDKRLLDDVSTEIPVIILHVSGHMCVANTKALELAGVTEDTMNPSGGFIGRVDGTNEPDGYLEENASGLVLGLLKGRIRFSPFKMIKTAQREYLCNGITTVQDGATNSAFFMLLKILSSFKIFKFDIVSYLMMDQETFPCMEKNKRYHNCYHKNLKIGGYKVILDGSPQARSAWLSKPYEGEDEYCGYPRMDDELLETYCKKAIDENVQILAHCNGDAASEQFLNCYEKAYYESDNINKKSLRPVMIHCQTVRKDQLDRMRNLQMIASVFVGHVYYWGDVHVKNLGSERGNAISPVKSALDCGLCVTFHQDTPVTKPDMLHSVWCAVNRKTRTGKLLSETEKIDVMEALKAVTIRAAYSYYEEDVKGSIKIGKQADFVILSDNPLITDCNLINEIKVLKTIKAGKIVYEN